MTEGRGMFWRREIGPFHDGATRLEPGCSMGARISDKGEVLGNPRGTAQVLRMGECDVRFDLHRRTPAGTSIPEAQRYALRGVVTAMLAEGLKAAGDANGIVILPGTKASADLGDGIVVWGEVLRYIPGKEIVIHEDESSDDDPGDWTISLEGNALTIRGDALHIGPVEEDDADEDDGEAGECDDADDAWERAQETQYPDGDPLMEEARSMAAQEGIAGGDPQPLRTISSAYLSLFIERLWSVDLNLRRSAVHQLTYDIIEQRKVMCGTEVLRRLLDLLDDGETRTKILEYASEDELEAILRSASGHGVRIAASVRLNALRNPSPPTNLK